MAAVTVNLPKDHPAVFPPACIGCGADQPTTTWRVVTHEIGILWTFVLMGHGPKFSTDAPACPDCRRRLRRTDWVRTVIIWASAFAGVGLAVWLIGFGQGFWGKWLVFGLALLGFVPMVVWEEFRPPVLDLTAYSETVDYDFRDPAYAEAFRALNVPQKVEA